MARIDTTIRRWCDQCQRVTQSVMCSNGHSPDEICAEEPCPYCRPEDDKRPPYTGKWRV